MKKLWPSSALLVSASLLFLGCGSENQGNPDEGNNPRSGSVSRQSPFDFFGLNLPDNPVHRRVNRHFYFSGDGPETLVEIEGAGCIRRFWITGRNIARDTILRIYFDGEPVPYVETPLADFFGSMHDLMGDPGPREVDPERRYEINTPFINVKPWNGFTSYFAMPFAENARIEIEGSGDGGSIYYIIDWHEYPGGEMEENRRFAARWRREAPVRDYEDDFIMFDADGPGQLVGFVLGVDMLEDRHSMRWSHAGAESIYIDGLSRRPAYLRAIGGEDSFGSSYSGHAYPQQTSIFSDIAYYRQMVPGRTDVQRFVGYRFFPNEALHFEDGMHMRWGSRAHDKTATVYWYTERPVRPYFEMPPVEKRKLGSELLRGEYDLAFPHTGQWWLAGPFPGQELEYELPGGPGFDPREPFYGRTWRRYDSLRGFVDFNHVYRPAASNYNSPTILGIAVARATLYSSEATTAEVTLGWSDRLVLQVNGGEPIDMGNHDYLGSHTVEVLLQVGDNDVALWLSNTEGLTRGAWVFSFLAETGGGEVLLPEAPGEAAPVPAPWSMEPGRLLSHWKLDESAGDVAADSSGNGYDASLASRMGDENWREGEGIHLNGVDEYLEVRNALAWVDLKDSAFSLSGWVKTQSEGTNTIISRKAFVGNPKVQLDVHEGGARFRVRKRKQELCARHGEEFACDSGGTFVADGEWHHVAGVKDAGALRLYVNGTEVASKELPDDAGNLKIERRAHWYIGARPANNPDSESTFAQYRPGFMHFGDHFTGFFEGRLADVRIHSYALDDEEIADLARQRP